MHRNANNNNASKTQKTIWIFYLHVGGDGAQNIQMVALAANALY